MVDVDSALRASAYSGKKKAKGERKKEEKMSRKLDPFDPPAAFEKEKADAYSMWLVITLGFGMGILMRYGLMPRLDNPETVLWLIPVLFVATLPSLHRLLIPDRISDLYDRGNWFRASFLYLFSWLAISFILVNPPLADIASPTLSGGLDIADTDGIVESEWEDGVYTIGLNQNSVDVILGMSVRDNVDAETAHLEVSIWLHGTQIAELANGTVIEMESAQSQFNSVNSSWIRGDKVAPHHQDIGLAFDLGTLTPNEYTVKIYLSEVGDPWDINDWEREYIIDIAQVTTV